MKIDFPTLQQLVQNGIPFVQRTGLEILEARRGYVKLKMPLKGNENHVNTMYLGAQCVLVDMPGGSLFLTSFDREKYFPVVKEMTLRYLKMAKTDLFIEGHLSEEKIDALQQEVEEKGKADFDLEFDILDTNGVLVTQAKAIYTILKVRT